MHVTLYWTFTDDAGPTHRDPILRGVVRVIGSSSIVPYESLVDLLRVKQRVEERSHLFKGTLVGVYKQGVNFALHTEIQTNHRIAIISTT